MWLDVLKAFFIGVIQGITEWLPISSTGHMILFNQFFPMNVSEAFMEMFRVVIQFGSILAVLVLYFDRLNPWSKRKTAGQKTRTWRLWGKVILAAVPAGIVGVLFDDWMNAHFYTYTVVAIALIVYGIAFIVIERVRGNKAAKAKKAEDISVGQSVAVGCFQVLSLIPGTSRSGSTIMGALIAGVSRTAAAEFSFFLAIPVMLGASLLKITKYVFKTGIAFSGIEWMTLAVGIITAFVVSLIVIRFLTDFVRRHSFAAFGWYRIVLGAIVLLYGILR